MKAGAFLDRFFLDRFFFDCLVKGGTLHVARGSVRVARGSVRVCWLVCVLCRSSFFRASCDLQVPCALDMVYLSCCI